MRPIQKLAALLLLWCSLSLAQPAPQTGVVTTVADGDTITVKLEGDVVKRIRLQGIDAPEHSMPYSQVSRRHLRELVLGREVSFIPEKLDRHGRTVAVVRLPDGTDVCLAQIEAGLAWHYKRFELEQTPDDRAQYAAAEAAARAGQRGLWRDNSPTAPWVFRAQFGR